MEEFELLVQGRAKGEKGREAMEFEALTVKSIDVEKRQITAIASTETLDRDDEIIRLEAFKKAIPAFMKNPVILAGHQHRLADGRSPVVGTCAAAWVDKKAFYITVQFADTELGLEYWKLYSKKYQRGFSVGYFTKKSEYELIDGRRVNVITEMELFEISCVPVPANPEALSKGKQRKQEFVDNKRRHSAGEKPALKRWDELTDEDVMGMTDEELEGILENDPKMAQKGLDYAEALFLEREEEIEPEDPELEVDLAGLVKGNNVAMRG